MEWNFKGFGLFFFFFKALLKDYIAKVKFVVLIFSFKTSQPWRVRIASIGGYITSLLLRSQCPCTHGSCVCSCTGSSHLDFASLLLPSLHFTVFKVRVSPRNQAPFSYFNSTF